MIDDEKIIELFFERSEQGIRELDIKYGKICRNLSYNIVNSRQDAEECVNDAYLGAWNAIPPVHPTQNLLGKGGCQTKRALYDCIRGNRGLYRRPENRGR